MPRIVPIQLLKCLKVLLNVNGGILSSAEVKRIAGLMSKYSKKLVSKCIYVQILKCTDTELLGEFMAVGGWGLVHTWLSDGIRLMNWPLVQEILELLLLCPVDVNRLKINSAPKLVKSLCSGGNEGVCILAKRLVEQWLKIVTEGNEQQQAAAIQSDAQPVQSNQTSIAAITTKTEPSDLGSTITESAPKSEPQSDAEDEDDEEEDPLALPDDDTSVDRDSLTPTIAQKNASKTGLVYKIVVRNGQQLLTKVESKSKQVADDETDGRADEMNENEAIIEEDDHSNELVEEDSTSLDKLDDKEVENGADDQGTNDKTQVEEHMKDKQDSKEHHERRKSKDGKNKEHKSEKDKDRKSTSSSSSHRSSSSGHKSSSKSSSSSSKSKSSSSPSSHRSSSDKHRSDKDRSNSSSSSNSSKDKDRSSSSSSSKHKSSSKSSSSSSSSSKDRHREKDKDKSSSSSSSSSSTKKDKEREKELQAEKDKDTLAKMLPPSLDKLGKIPKKPKEEKGDSANSSSSNSSSSNKPTSITIPSKKASMSIEIRRDTEKTATVKTYKSQFRSHGLTEEAPPPPSRKTLKKPASTVPAPGTVIPTSLPSSLKRSSPPPRESPSEKKAKIDINQITPAAANVEKPGAIKLIPAKRIQTLVETNLFSDALSAATGPKKVVKRKRPSNSSKDEPTTPTSPDAPKVAPLKFYQDTLDESAKAANEERAEKSKDDEANNNSSKNTDTDKENAASITDEDDDIPLKKVKEDIEQRVRKEKAAAANDSIDITSDGDEEEKAAGKTTPVEEEVRKPGPGCGPDGPPGVLMLHRRKGPKKKLTWRPQDQLEQIRYFELDENERVNVMKVSFHDMKNMERFNERASLTNLTKRGPRPGDNQEPRTEWRPLIEIDDVPIHPDGAQSKERKVQADREMTTLRALYFSPNMIPDSASEAEIEPHYPGDPPTIPLDDITGNQDTINDFSGMPWPEPKGSPKHGDSAMSGTGGLSSLGNPAAEMFPSPVQNNPTNMKNPFNNGNNFMNAFGGNSGPGPNNMPMGPQHNSMPMPPNGWQGPPKNMPVPLMSANFSNHPNADMMPGGPNFMPQHGQFNGPPPFMQNRNGPFGPPPGFNGPNFGQMGPGNPMGPMGNNMGPMPLMNVNNGPPRGGNNNRNNNHNWMNGPNNFQDNNMNNGGWRPAGPGPNRSGPNNMGGNNGVCKAFMRSGGCRLGKACKFIHPKNKRL